jgi:hypothetical protein
MEGLLLFRVTFGYGLKAKGKLAGPGRAKMLIGGESPIRAAESVEFAAKKAGFEQPTALSIEHLGELGAIVEIWNSKKEEK